MTAIYRELSAEQHEHYRWLKQRTVDKTELFNKSTEEYIWVLSNDANDSIHHVYIESIVFFNASHDDNNAIFFLKDPSVPGGISYLTKPRDQACASILGLFENLRIGYNGLLTTIPDLYIKAIKKYYTKEPTIDLKKEFDNFKPDTSVSHSIEKRNDAVETKTTEPIYRHPNCSGGFDTYLTIVAGYGTTPPNDVLIGTWRTVREIYPDGTIITTDGDKLAPALGAYADIFKTAGVYCYPTLIYHVLAVNSKNPSQKGQSPTGYRDFYNNNPYDDVIRRAQQCVGPYTQRAK